MTDHVRMLLALGDAIHERSATLGPGVTTTRIFRVSRPLTAVGPSSHTWLRPYSSKRWALRDAYDSLDRAIGALWFGADA